MWAILKPGFRPAKKAIRFNTALPLWQPADRQAGTEEYLYGKHPSVTRWHDLENHPEKLAGSRERGLYSVRGIAG